MKTWQMLKELMENPEKRFKRTYWKDSSYITAENHKSIYHSSGDRYGIYDVVDEEEWAEVQTEVTWQEGIKAWGAGKIVSVEVGGCRFKLTHDDSIFGLSERMINLGKWYIL